MPGTGTSRMASAAPRPETQPTSAKRSTSRTSRPIVSAGTADRSGCSTIGASVPSMSSRIAERPGSARNGSRGSDATRVRYAAMPERSAPWWTYVGIGSVAGFFAALFGVGGGIVIVPLLMAFARFEPKRATATSLAAILFTGVYGAARYEWSGHVHWGEAAAVGLPACAGVVAGTWLQQRLSSDALTLAVRRGHGRVGLRLADRGLTWTRRTSSRRVLGVLAGCLAGLFGVGGGIVFVPALTLGVGLGQLDAEATSLAAMVPVVLLGSWQQHRRGLVAWRPAVAVGLTSVGGVLAGAAVAESLPEDVLARLFGGLLIVLALRMARQTRARTRAARRADATG